MARRALLLLCPALVAVAACAPVKKATPQLRSAVFECTGGAQTWMVPPGVTSAGFDVYGAAGGDGANHAGSPDPLGVGGKGGRAAAGLAVTPGESIQLNVGCKGIDGTIRTGGAGGFNGGGDGGDGGPDDGGAGGGGGGGGASDVRRAGTDLANRVVVGAAGGGGGGNCSTGDCGISAVDPGFGGAGAHPTGGKGGEDFSGGNGGTQTAGGTAVFGDATDGAANAGGDGANVGALRNGGGGGGGSGLFGGGGGGHIRGGGGGSSFGPGDATFENGVRAGHGLVVVYWVA